MNNLIRILLCILLPFSSFAQNVHEYVIGDTLIMNPKWKSNTYKPFKDKLPDGKYLVYSDSTKLRPVFNFYFKDGKADSSWKEFYPNGNLKVSRNYLTGKYNGLQQSYYDNGQQKDSVFFKDDKMEGAYLKWHPNGKLAEQKFYYNGNIYGDWVVWYETGRPNWIYINDYRLRHRTEITWYESGQVKSLKQYRFKPHVTDEEVKKPENWGVIEAVNYKCEANFSTYDYDPVNGTEIDKKKKNISAKMRDSVWIFQTEDKKEKFPKFQMLLSANGNQYTWFQNGQIATYYEVENGKQNGKEIKWNEKGQKLEEGAWKVFTEGKFNAMSRKDGKWLYYDYNGKLHKEEIYEDGELKEEKYY